jgi:hypothetical protein
VLTTPAKSKQDGSSANPWTRPALSARGFVGWATFDKFRTADVCPDVGGVYVVVRPDSEAPCFLELSRGGWFKDRDPTVTPDALRANWVSGAEVVYIGKANSIRRRLREFAKFGAGQKIGHWGGRLIWQLTDSATLVVGWMPTPGRDPLTVEGELIAEFKSQYGKAPFANDPHRLGL